MSKRILHCSPAPLDRRLGAAKVYIEAGESFRSLGWKSDIVGTAEIEAATSSGDRATRLREYLRRYAGDYDVVEYEHCVLPYPRSDFPKTTLMVARSVLIMHHLLRYPVPSRPGFGRSVLHFLKGPVRRRRLQEIVDAGTRTCLHADLVNLCNTDEAAEMQRHGVDPAKIVVFPFGLRAERRRELETVDLAPPARPCVAFVGTFDPRKGMRIFPRLVAAVVQAVPDARFKLLGTAGMLATAEEVYGEFPVKLRSAIDVVPRFEPHELPKLLGDCTLGVFPSLVEGFGFGVLEMLGAGLPVVAFRAPGPPMMLADEYLVRSNDVAAMATKVVGLLTDRNRLAGARAEARRRSRDFEWDEIIARTAETYEERLAALRASACK